MKIEFVVTDDDGKNYQGIAELKAVAEPRGTNERRGPAAAGTEVGGLPGRILALREDNFFREPRTPGEVHAKLLETYHCLPNRVQMALLRLHRRRQLRKTVKIVSEREQTAYVW